MSALFGVALAFAVLFVLVRTASNFVISDESFLDTLKWNWQALLVAFVVDLFLGSLIFGALCCFFTGFAVTFL